MIDWTRVSDLKAEIGDDGFVELAALFLEETDEVADRLATRPQSADLGRDMHFLKGSALNLGFSDLASMCQDAERRAAQSEGHLIDLGQILACYRLSKTAFLEGLGRQTAA